MPDSASPKTQTIQFNRLPHEGRPPKFPVGQKHVLQACLDHRYVTGMFGRGWGKTAIPPFLIFAEGAQPKFQGQVYDFAYVAPYNDGAYRMYQYMKRAYAALLSDHMGLTNGHNDSRQILHLRGFNGNAGAVLEFWGADNFEGLRGPRKHRIVVDECKDIHPSALRDVILPMGFARDGHYLFLGTPGQGQGSGWFREMFRNGQDPTKPHYKSFNAPSFANPYITQVEIDAFVDACKGSETAIRQELYAEIIEDDGAVFERLNEAFCIPFTSDGSLLYRPVHMPVIHSWDRVMVGVDFGRKHDATVAKAFLHRTREEVGMLRMFRTPFPQQLERLNTLVASFPCETMIVADERGLGQQAAEELGVRYGEGFLRTAWTEDTKERDITAARFLFSEARWKFLAVPWAKSEFADYQIISKDSQDRWLKRPRYGAPPDQFDDAVCAACLIAPHLSRAFWTPTAPAPRPAIGTGAWHLLEMDRVVGAKDGTYRIGD